MADALALGEHGTCSRRVFLVHFDSSLPAIVACDASPLGVGAVLSQQPIQFESRSLTRAEQKYSQNERELLGIIVGVNVFYIFFCLAGRSFMSL